MTNKSMKILRIGIYGAAVALTINAIRLAAIRDAGQVGPESTFTAVLQETVSDPTRNFHRKGSIQTRAVRADGSTVLKLGSAEAGSRLIWFASGLEVMTNDRLRLKSTIRKPGTSQHRDPRAGCTDPHAQNEKSSGEEIIAGYRSARVISIAGKPPQSRTSTTWYAVDHGCATIQSTLEFEEGSLSEWRLVTFVPGEPAATLYAISGDYKEGPPSALEGPSVVVATCGTECQERQRVRKQSRDAEYYKNRP